MREILANNLKSLMDRTPALSTQAKLHAKSGVGQTTIGRILRRDVAATADNIEALAMAFGLTGSELLAPTPGAGSLNIQPEEAIHVKFKDIPVVGTAQMGNDGYWEELQYPVGHGDGVVSYPSGDPNAYALRCEGDSMSPRYRHGEYVVIEPNQEVVPGDEVMIKTKNGRSMVKVFNYERDGRIYLESINENHGRLILAKDEIDKMHYVAGGVKRTLWRKRSS